MVLGVGTSPLDFSLGRIAPNPVAGATLDVSFTLPTSAPAMLELLDVTGRRVASRNAGGKAPGRYTINLAEGVRLSPGIYMVRLSQGGRRLTSRVAVLR